MTRSGLLFPLQRYDKLGNLTTPVTQEMHLLCSGIQGRIESPCFAKLYDPIKFSLLALSQIVNHDMMEALG